LLTKGVPIETVAILAREFQGSLMGRLNADELAAARNFLFDPGISVVRDAQLAMQFGQVTAMHDPTEGGVATALWELAEASAKTLVVDPASIPVPPLGAKICAAFALDPLACIASGALLMTVAGGDAASVRAGLEGAGIPCAIIGLVEDGGPAVLQPAKGGLRELPRPGRDAIARLFEICPPQP
jgi:hydrogenase maturation factor